MLRRMLIAFVVFIIAVVVVADRVGEKVAAHVLAGKLQTDEHLPTKPSASISGFPFLTQAIGGKYKDVSVTAHDFVTDGVRVSTMTVHLHGVHLPLSKVVSGSVHQVPIDHVDGSATVTFAAMRRYLGTHGVTVTFNRGPDGSLKVRDSVTLHGQKVTVTEAVGLSVTNNVITLTLSGVKLPIGSVLAIPLQGLPFRVTLHTVTVGTSGVSATGTADHVVLGS